MQHEKNKSRAGEDTGRDPADHGQYESNNRMAMQDSEGMKCRELIQEARCLDFALVDLFVPEGNQRVNPCSASRR